MKKLKLTILFYFSVFIVTAQTKNDTLNKFNKNNKKDGYWVKYLDGYLNPTDSINSYFYGYELFDNGYRVFPLESHKWCKKYYFSDTTTPTKKGHPIILNGHFKWYWYKGGPIANEEIYINGHPKYFKTYSWLDTIGTSAHNEVIYFDKLYNGIRGTLFYEEYGLHGRLDNSGYMYKDKDGKWRSHYIKVH